MTVSSLIPQIFNPANLLNYFFFVMANSLREFNEKFQIIEKIVFFQKKKEKIKNKLLERTNIKKAIHLVKVFEVTAYNGFSI